MYSRYGFARVFKGNRDQGIKSSQALKALLGFLSRIEELGYTLKKYGAVWTDDGGEFKSVFRSYLKSNDIPQVVSKVGDQRKNRNIERFNKTLRMMIEKYANIYGKKIDQKVIDKLIDGYNRSIHKSLDGLTPYEALKDMKKSRSLFRYYVDLKNANKDKPEEEELEVGTWCRYYIRGDNLFKKVRRNWSKGIHKIEKKEGALYKLEGVRKWFRRDRLQPINLELFNQYNYAPDRREQVRDDETSRRRKIRITRDIADVMSQPVLEGKRIRRPKLYDS